MKIINLIQNILSPYFNAVKVDFKPLEYIEVKQDKPLIIKLTDKYFFKCCLQSPDDFINFNASKNIVLNQLEKLNDLKSNDIQVSRAKVLSFRLIIRLLFEISKKEYKGFFAKRKYYKFLNKYLFDNIEILIKIFDTVLRYNVTLKKKLQNLLNFQIFGEDASETTVGGVPLKDLIVTDPVTGKKHFKH